MVFIEKKFEKLNKPHTYKKLGFISHKHSINIHGFITWWMSINDKSNNNIWTGAISGNKLKIETRGLVP